MKIGGKHRGSIWASLYIIGLVFMNIVAAQRYLKSQQLKVVESRPAVGHRYTIERLELPPQTKFYHGGAAINDSSQVAGTFMPDGRPMSAVVWDRGRYTKLGTLGGQSSVAFDINNAGQVAGWSNTQSGVQRAFLWKQGRMLNLGVAPGFADSVATSLNQKGWIVGRSFTNSGGPYWSWPCHATLWKERKIYDLGVPPGCINSRATSINSYGQIAGWATNKDNQMTAILWQDGKWIDLGKQAGKAVSSGNFIDEQGTVVGTSGNSDDTMRATVWKHGRVVTLPPLPFHTANRLTVSDANGMVFGDAKVGKEWRSSSPVIWPKASEAPVELDRQLPDESEWFLLNAYDVNRHGQVIVLGMEANSVDDLAILTPIHRKKGEPSP